ncbi:hypothetical protein BGX33_008408 [Mortierella sp. NVP41]|nr:hypothetical protein BGX33_008408 [Mortierella sp. NVP41]
MESYKGTQFGRLEKLTFKVNPGTWAALADVVRNSPRLSELVVYGQREVLPGDDDTETEVDSFWRAVRKEGAPLLKSLVFKSVVVEDEEAARALWETCRQVGIRTLHLHDTDFGATGSSSRDGSINDSNNDNNTNDHGQEEEENGISRLLPEFDLDSIVDFELEDSYSHHSGLDLPYQLRLLRRLPHLKRLLWRSYDEKQQLHVQQVFQEENEGKEMGEEESLLLTTVSSWPLLEDLKLSMMGIPYECLTTILAGLVRPLERLSIDGLWFGPGNLATSLFVSLGLDLDGGSGSLSSQQRPLHCGTLRALVVSAVLKFEDVVVRGQPWVCTGLRRLSVFIDLEESWSSVEETERRQRLVLDRIGGLKRLEFLNVGRRGFGEAGPNALVFSLRRGLEALKDLDRLQSVALESCIQEMERDDVEWMVKTWTRLSHIQSNICSDMARRAELTAYLESHRVHVEDWQPSGFFWRE